jgi:hypothetical protein
VDCDDQIGFVKSYDNAHANPPDHPRVSRLPLSVLINMDWLGDHCFCIRNARFHLPGLVFGVPRHTHAGTSHYAEKLSPARELALILGAAL